jgi:hypothetical protein
MSLSKVYGGLTTSSPWFFFSFVFQVPIFGLRGTNVRKNLNTGGTRAAGTRGVG